MYTPLRYHPCSDVVVQMYQTVPNPTAFLMHLQR